MHPLVRQYRMRKPKLDPASARLHETALALTPGTPEGPPSSAECTGELVEHLKTSLASQDADGLGLAASTAYVRCD